jgi:predicted DNA binding CopG/RHH family protein
LLEIGIKKKRKKMIKRVPLKSGDEMDAFSKWRKFLNFKRGELKKIKRAYNKRLRKANKETCQ